MQNDGGKFAFKAFTREGFKSTSFWSKLDSDQQQAFDVVSRVLPFRVNNHVTNNLIDWDNLPYDPIFRLTFPQRDMLDPEDYAAVCEAMVRSEPELNSVIRQVREKLNPNPAGQKTHNVPTFKEAVLEGAQHKYKETLLLFPSQGQTCHAYCSFCFRWPQFVDDKTNHFRTTSIDTIVEYIQSNPSITDVLFTGGDPLTMSSRRLSSYIVPILDRTSVQTVRIGTKALCYWPARFVSDSDAGDLSRLFELVRARGRHLAIMAHVNHARELQPVIVKEALARVLSTGAVVRIQAPVLRNINDKPQDWIDVWNISVRLGCVPYYMFVERDTGASRYFKLPLAQAYDIFQSAYSRVSGLGRSVRGPVMSAHDGKVLIDGVVQFGSHRLFALQFLQSRNPEAVRKPFYAKFDPSAAWFDDLQIVAPEGLEGLL